MRKGLAPDVAGKRYIGDVDISVVLEMCTQPLSCHLQSRGGARGKSQDMVAARLRTARNFGGFFKDCMCVRAADSKRTDSSAQRSSIPFPVLQFIVHKKCRVA